MAFTALTAGQVDAKSPVSDDWTDLVRTNLDHLKSAISDGASASQVLTVDQVTVAGTGTAFTVNNNSQFDGDVNVDGTLTTGVFFSSEQLLLLMS